MLPSGHCLPLSLSWDLLEMSSLGGAAHALQTAGKPGNHFTNRNVVIPTSVKSGRRFGVLVFLPNICEILFPLRENGRAAGKTDQIFWLLLQPPSPCRQHKNG